jgi:tyrosyl-tRNA synthetase
MRFIEWCLTAIIRRLIWSRKRVDVRQQLEIIRRGAEQIVPEQELVAKLERSARTTGAPLRVKYGIDPTGIDVHLGHTVPLRKLRQFQELGHKAIIIIGNYTALVGDPSGRDETRARLTPETVEANARDYLKQISKIVIGLGPDGQVLDASKVEVHRNGDWFSGMRFLDVLELASKMTIQQLLAREDFDKRRKAEVPIYLHECLYPLMQGWDSVEIRADVELGGSEQLFSLLVGRELQRERGQQPQVAITLPILVGTDGTRRMGKSLGNYIGVAEPPDEMFGKLMSIPDSAMRSYFELLTDRPIDEFSRLLAPGVNPRDAKAALARDIVGQYHGAAAATAAAGAFDRRFREGQDPAEIPEVQIPRDKLKQGKIWIARLLVTAGFASSTTEAKRLVAQGAVNVGPERRKITDPQADIGLPDGLVVRVGSRRIARMRLAPGNGK